MNDQTLHFVLYNVDFRGKTSTTSSGEMIIKDKSFTTDRSSTSSHKLASIQAAIYF
jgi:hypothetical protein